MLKKLIKNYQDTSNPQVRIKYGIVAGIFGIITNIILFGIKFFIGLLAGSITIIADAINNLSDFGSSIVTILGFKLASKPADKEHPYGHARYEYIAGLIVSISILLIGVIMAKTSIDKMISPEPITVTNLTYLILMISIVGKFIQMMTYKDFSNSINSPTLKAAAIDARNDIITTGAVLLSTVLMDIFGWTIDAYTGFAVSVFIMISAIRSLRETVDPLLGTSADLELVDKIKNIVLSHEEVKGIHDLLIHSYGNGNNFATVHAEVSAFMSLIDAHYLADEIEREVQDTLNLGLTVHIDPIEPSNAKTKEIRRKCKSILKKFDNSLQVQDLRIVASSKDNKMNVIFDVIVPFGKKYSKDELIKVLTDNFVNPENDSFVYNFIVKLDRPISWRVHKFEAKTKDNMLLK
jgi:cation diffusion facilitator family transporter